MSDDARMRMDVEAARTLALWKERFAEEVLVAAREHARRENRSGSISLAHLRLGAGSAIVELMRAIQAGREGQNDAGKRAA